MHVLLMVNGLAVVEACGGVQGLLELLSTSSFARFSYCGRGFARSARFTSYGNPVSVHC